jgi:amidase
MTEDSQDRTDGFMPGPRLMIQSTEKGYLEGLSFAAKDVFDVAGYPTGAGNPDWPRFHPVPERHATVIEQLLGAGASFAGKTVTCELTLGILGFNAHCYTPVNPRAPDCFPGGSSSGSAAVVASGLCDFALGTDSGGSVRVPSSFCGLFGLRPTHGRISKTGMVAQAPSFDTVGWFARSGDVLSRVGEVLLQSHVPDLDTSDILIATDALALVEKESRDVMERAIGRLAALVKGKSQDVELAPDGRLLEWAKKRALLQRAEAAETFRPFLERANPRLHFSVARNLARMENVSKTAVEDAMPARIEAVERARALLERGAFLCIPATPFSAPGLTSLLPDIDHLSARIGELTSFAGLAGLPQITLPAAGENDKPIGISVIGWRGADERLLALGRQWIAEGQH